MLSRLRRHLSPPMVISCLALFVALGGAGYAATVLPAGSVGTPQIQKGAVTTPKIAKDAVTGAKIKDHSIAAADLSRGLLARGTVGSAGTPGAKGDPGPKGDTGAQGPAGVMWASAGTTLAPPYHSNCSTPCVQILSQPFTSPATGKLYILASVTLKYTCDGTNPPGFCSPIIGLYVDGVPLVGANEILAAMPASVESGDLGVTVAGVTPTALPAGPHIVEAQLTLNGGRTVTLVNTSGFNVSELLING